MALTRRDGLKTAAAGAVASLSCARTAAAQVKARLSIATGGTGGVYYPLGGGIAALISKHAPGVEATAEATAASVDNLKLLHTGTLGLSGADIAAEAYQGQLKRLKEKVALRTIASIYSNFMHVVTLESTSIQTVAALKGRRVSPSSSARGSTATSPAFSSSCTAYIALRRLILVAVAMVLKLGKQVPLSPAFRQRKR